MNTARASRIPTWFWIVALLALAWEAFGAYTYTSQSMIPDGQRVGDYATMAAWQWGVFATAVWSGVAGAVALLLKSRWAVALLLLSLLAAVVQYGHAALNGGISSQAFPIAVAVLVVGVVLVIISSRARRAGWLR
jgi:hypothetical protein